MLVAPPARNAAYIAVDIDDNVLDIGQVNRSACNSLMDRFEDHHAVPSWAVGVWVLPLGDDCDPLTINRFERQMIRKYSPAFNVQDVRHTRYDGEAN